MANRNLSLSVAFSCMGHAFIHFFTSFYFIIVLSIEVDWQQNYTTLIELWTLGALLVGVAALPAGWLGDRWSASGMMTIFFIGIGTSSVISGLAPSSTVLMLGLSGIGLFAAIYHPVGIPWLIRNTSANRGKLLAINALFGTLGSAIAGVVSGTLIDLFHWRMAFMIPGGLSVLIGIVLWYCHLKKMLITRPATPKEQKSQDTQAMWRAFLILLFTMFCGGMIYHTTQISLPKVFETHHQGIINEGTFGVGLLVTFVYGTAAICQIVIGVLADRYPLKNIYLLAFCTQAPLLWLVSTAGGMPLVLMSTLMVLASVGVLPVENMLLAKYTPESHYGLAFGTKFLLSFGVAPLAVQMVATINSQTNSFYWVFIILTAFAGAVVVVGSFLPSQRKTPILVPGGSV